MPAQIHELAAIVTSNVRGFVQGLRLAGDVTKGLRTEWSKAAVEVGRSADRVAMAIGAVGTAGVAAAAKVGISFNSMKRSAEIGFTTMLGSGEKARAFLEDLSAFAAKTPFELRGLIGVSQKLLAMGFDAKQVLPTLNAVGNAVAGLGGDPQVLDQVVRALGQIKAKGKASAEEMLQISEAGIGGWQMLADHLGVTVPQAMKQVEKGAVDADTTIAALVAGMEGKFGGLMAELSTEFVGLTSNIKDAGERALGEVTEPLFQGLTRWAARLNEWMGSGEFKALIADARDGVADLTMWLERSWPAIQQTAAEWAEFLRPVAEFIADHPRLVAALAAFSVLQKFGVVGAITATASAVWELGKAGADLAGIVIPKIRASLATLSAEMGRSTVQTKALYSAMSWASIGLHGAAAAGIAAGILLIADAFGMLGAKAEDAGDQAARTQRILAAQQNKLSADRSARMAEARAQGVGGLRGLEAELQREAGRAGDDVNNLERRLAIAQQRAGGAGAVADQAGSYVLQGMGLGFADRAQTAEEIEVEAARTALEDARRRKEESEAALAAAQRERQLVEAEIGERRQGVAAVQQTTEAQGEVAAAVEKTADQVEKEQKKIAEQFEAARQQALARETDGYANVRDLLGLQGATGADVARFAGSMDGMTQDLAGQLGSGFDAIGGAGGDSAALDALAQKIAAAAAGNVEADKRAEVASDAGRSFVGTVDGLGLPQEVVDGLWAQMDSIANAFVNGAMSADEFRAATDAVADSARNAAAAEAQHAEFQQEVADLQREQTIKSQEDALARGDFEGAGLNGDVFAGDVQALLRKKMLEANETRWSQAVEATVNGLLGINDAAQTVTKGLDGFGGRMADGFRKGGDADPGKMAEAIAGVMGFLNTTAGRVATLQNEIAFAYQRMRYLGLQEKEMLLDAIAAMKAEIDRLVNAPPVFAGMSDDGFFADPGLVGQQGGGGGGTNVYVSFPNVTRVSNNDAAMLADAVASANAHRGGKY